MTVANTYAVMNILSATWSVALLLLHSASRSLVCLVNTPVRAWSVFHQPVRVCQSVFGSVCDMVEVIHRGEEVRASRGEEKRKEAISTRSSTYTHTHTHTLSHTRALRGALRASLPLTPPATGDQDPPRRADDRGVDDLKGVGSRDQEARRWRHHQERRALGLLLLPLQRAGFPGGVDTDVTRYSRR